MGNVKRQISPRGYDVGGSSGPWNDYVTSYSYDALGQQARTSLPKAGSETQLYTHNSFDQNGRLVWTSVATDKADPAQVAAADKTVNEYWDTGGLYSTTVGGSQKVRYDYTAEGWQAWRLPETAEGTGVADYGRMMFWEYLPDGLLKAERDLAGQRSSYAYDPNGNRTGASEAQSIAGEVMTIASTFDGFDQLETVKTPKVGSSDFWKTTFAYDLHGNVTQLDENKVEAAGGSQVTAPRVFTYTYDNGDQPSVQTDDFGTSGTDTDDERFSFSFDDLGRLTQRKIEKRTGASSYATEQTQDSTYYWNGLLKTLVSKDGAGTPNTIASHSLSYITSGVYLNGNKAGDTFRVVGPDAGASCRSSDCTASWEYDSRDRLTKEINGSGTTSEFTLDKQGNATEEKRNSSTHHTATFTGQRLSTTTASGTTLKYLHDAQGNVDCIVLSSWASSSCPTASTGQSVASELVSDNAYDYRDRLIAVRAYSSGTAGDRTEYRYDPLGRPIKKTATEGSTTTTTDLVYLAVADAVVRETETGSSTKTRNYAFDALGDRATISETVSGTTSRWSYLNDPLGSAELLIDQSNTVKASYGYLPYGDKNDALTKTASGFTPNSNLYRYTGKRFDPAANAYDMGARTYMPGLGRWFQQDRYPDGLDNLALSTDPLTQNRYAFTAANPINYVELDGHRVADVDGTLAPGTEGVQTPPTVDWAGPGATDRSLALSYPALQQFGHIFDPVRSAVRSAMQARTAFGNWCAQHEVTCSVVLYLATRSGGKYGPRGNVADGPRLAAQVAGAEAAAIFTKSGGLKASVIKKSREIKVGDEIGNAAVRSDLKAMGGQLSDWGKYSTPTFQSPAGGFQVHFYYNPTLKRAFYGRDYKAKFIGRP
jgi:RHS repeat-associated protein